MNTLSQIIQFAKPRENTSIVGGSTREKRKREPDVAFASIPLTAGSTPNSVLFAQALPPEVSEQTLKVIFGQCTGFLEVRLAPGARGFAFIQFEDEVQSTMALKQLHGFQLSSTHALQLAYANV